MFKPSTFRRLRPLAACAVAGLIVSAAAVARTDTPAGAVPYPDGYRTWRHVKSEIVEPGHPQYASVGGLHHIYANDVAVAGYQAGRFADGAVIVFDVLEIASDPNTRVTSERARRSVWVMHKDAKRYAATGGWGFDVFKGDSTTERSFGANPGNACYACHAKAPAGVFSRYRP